jgi:N-acyl-D-amino-acid deacylase
MAYDLVFRNASVVDGSGAAAYEADVAVDAGRIVGVGSRIAEGRREVDARGLTLSPGFIDTHAHDDGALLRHPGMEFKVAQGVTTDVIGNCGFSVAPASRQAAQMISSSAILAVGEAGAAWDDQAGFHRVLSDNPPAINAIALAGHNTLRVGAGVGRDQPTSEQISLMKGWLEEAMEAGACGMSTGLFYSPGRWATTEEVIELARVVSPFGGLYATHMRDEGDGLLKSVEETLRIGREGGVTAHISHHKATGELNWGRVKESLALIDRALESGPKVTLDVYPYIAGSTRLEAMQHFVDEEIAEWIRVASSPTFPDFEGWSIAEIAGDMGTDARSATGRLLEGEGRETICLQFLMCEPDVETVLAHPLAMVGSDGIPVLEGKPHPRLFGTFPRVLGEYVRERAVIRLEEAVRKMTSLPAQSFGLKDRGLIKEGAWADLVLFDAASITDTATYEEPMQEPTGIKMVLVNGEVVFDDGTHTGARPGRVLPYEPDLADWSVRVSQGRARG